MNGNAPGLKAEEVPDHSKQGGFEMFVWFTTPKLPISSYLCKIGLNGANYSSNAVEYRPELKFTKFTWLDRPNNDPNNFKTQLMIRCQITDYYRMISEDSSYTVTFRRTDLADTNLVRGKTIAMYTVTPDSVVFKSEKTLDDHATRGQKHRDFPTFDVNLALDHKNDKYYCEWEDLDTKDRVTSKLVRGAKSGPPEEI